MEPFTLAAPFDAYKYEVGDTVVWERLRWHVRAWRWFTFRMLRRPRPVISVTHVDHKAGEITVMSGVQWPWERPMTALRGRMRR